jgi:hypothetical protein
MGSVKTRCVNCRSDILVPDTYASGDHIKCGVCGTQHKVQRGDVLRLILADIEPTRQALRENEKRISDLEGALSRARGSLGLGVNGFGVGLIYLLWQIGFKERALDAHLGREAILIAVLSAIFLEIANFLFLAKRATITRLTGEMKVLEGEGRVLQQRIRDASRK